MKSGKTCCIKAPFCSCPNCGYFFRNTCRTNTLDYMGNFPWLDYQVSVMKISIRSSYHIIVGIKLRECSYICQIQLTCQLNLIYIQKGFINCMNYTPLCKWQVVEVLDEGHNLSWNWSRDLCPFCKSLLQLIKEVIMYNCVESLNYTPPYKIKF